MVHALSIVVGWAELIKTRNEYNNFNKNLHFVNFLIIKV